MSKPISNRLPAVRVEYDSRGNRVSKTFADPVKARRFYQQKLVQGKRPVVRKGHEDGN